jgi:hypothetical protein
MGMDIKEKVKLIIINGVWNHNKEFKANPPPSFWNIKAKLKK